MSGYFSGWGVQGADPYAGPSGCGTSLVTSEFRLTMPPPGRGWPGPVAVTTDSPSSIPFPPISLLKQKRMKCHSFLPGSPGEQAIYEDLISITLFPMTGTGPPPSGAVSSGLWLVSTPAPRALCAGPGLPGQHLLRKPPQLPLPYTSLHSQSGPSPPPNLSPLSSLDTIQSSV